MWSFASSYIAGSGSIGWKKNSSKPTQDAVECSDDEVSSTTGNDEGLECPICWESFNIVENVPYVLWCGHTLCKNCILGLQWAILNIPPLPFQLPLFISCPWCNLLTPRVVYQGNLKFLHKNFFLLWMVERMNGDRVKSHPLSCTDCQSIWPVKLTSESQVSHSNIQTGQPSRLWSPNRYRIGNYLAMRITHSALWKFVVSFIQLTAKFPLVLIFLLIVLYAIPASAVVLALYILITVVFAVPSFLILYFAYPSLDWLVREIIA